MTKLEDLRLLAVVGSRDFYFDSCETDGDNLNQLMDIIDEIFEEGDFDAIISGGVGGIDTTAEAYAEKNGVPMIIRFPDWDEYGKAAGPIRTSDIVRDADYLLAFWDGDSAGTEHAINEAKDRKVPGRAVYHDGEWFRFRPEAKLGEF